MANNFYEWIDDENVLNNNNLLSNTDFADSQDRKRGFLGGEGASAPNVNTALRQANLVAKALMDLATRNDSSGVLSARSALASIISKLSLMLATYQHKLRITFNCGTGLSSYKAIANTVVVNQDPNTYTKPDSAAFLDVIGKNSVLAIIDGNGNPAGYGIIVSTMGTYTYSMYYQLFGGSASNTTILSPTITDTITQVILG